MNREQMECSGRLSQSGQNSLSTGAPMNRLAFLAVALSIAFATSVPAEDQKETPSSVERLLHGMWKGPACGGDWTFMSDGTFSVRHYTPGNNQLTGTWEMRWDALPPTLVLTRKTSDAPNRLPVGTVSELKIMQLNDETLEFQYPGAGGVAHCSRIKE
jgi:hypothetical protein